MSNRFSSNEYISLFDDSSQGVANQVEDDVYNLGPIGSYGRYKEKIYNHFSIPSYDEMLGLYGDMPGLKEAFPYREDYPVPSETFITDREALYEQQLTGRVQANEAADGMPVEITPAPETSWVHNSIEFLDFITSPLMAPVDFILAPLANPSEGETFFDRVAGDLDTAWNAAAKRMFPVYGQQNEFYGAEMVEDMLGKDANPVLKNVLGIGLEVLADPLTYLTFGTAAIAKQGIKEVLHINHLDTAAKAAKGERVEKALTSTKVEDEAPVITGESIFTRGLRRGYERHLEKTYGSAEEAIDAKKRHERLFEISEELGKDKEKNPKLMKEYNELVAIDEVLKGGIKSLEDQDLIKQYEKIKESLGDPNKNIVDVQPISGKKVSEDEVAASVNSQTSPYTAEINFFKLTDETKTQEKVDEIYDFFGNVYDDYVAKHVSDKEVIDQSQHEMLYDLVGIPAEHMTPRQAYGVRQGILATSNWVKFLAHKATLTGRKIDMVAYNKAVEINDVLQRKDLAIKANDGRSLRQHGIKSTTEAGRLMEIKEILKRVC